MTVAAVAWTAGLIWFAETIPRTEPPPTGEDGAATTDAIVVLTGGSDRLRTGLALLDAGRAHTLFVSGVHRTVDRAALLRVAGVPPATPARGVVLGYAADDTRGNAAETARWMRRRGYRSLHLVTANYHMRRSLLEFRARLGDVTVIAHPVVPAHVVLDGWWRRRGTARLIIGEYNKFLVALARIGLRRLVATPTAAPTRADGGAVG